MSIGILNLGNAIILITIPNRSNYAWMGLQVIGVSNSRCGGDMNHTCYMVLESLRTRIRIIIVATKLIMIE